MPFILTRMEDENGQEVNDGRMNLGVVTLNIPRIALEADGSLQKFWEIFEENSRFVKDALRLPCGTL